MKFRAKLFGKFGKFLYEGIILTINDDPEWIKTFTIRYPGWKKPEWMSLGQVNEFVMPFDEETFRKSKEERKQAIKKLAVKKKTLKSKVFARAESNSSTKPIFVECSMADSTNKEVENIGDHDSNRAKEESNENQENQEEPLPLLVVDLISVNLNRFMSIRNANLNSTYQKEIFLPDELYDVLVVDNELMNTCNMFFHLPASNTLQDILSDFCCEKLYFKDKDEFNDFALTCMVTNREQFFPAFTIFAFEFVAHLLLYRSELPAYYAVHNVREKGTKGDGYKLAFSKTYGFIHLLRLLIHFEDMFGEWLKERRYFELISERVQEFMQYLLENKAKYYACDQIYYNVKERGAGAKQFSTA